MHLPCALDGYHLWCWMPAFWIGLGPACRFVNFRPITEPDALFNPCSLAPLVSWLQALA